MASGTASTIATETGTSPGPGSVASPAAAAAVSRSTSTQTGTWRRWISDAAIGEASRRLGWSTSWASGSMPSSPARNIAIPASASSGVVPVQAPRSAAAATTASSPRRATRAAGHRSTPRRPRTKMGSRPLPVTRRRIQGRLRGSSRASWRRSTTTVRRSWSVAAKRSWPTRVDRRSAASSDTVPTSESPRSARAAPDTTGTRPSDVEVQGPEQEPAEGLGGADADHVGALEDGRGEQPHADERGDPPREAERARDVRGADAEGDRGEAPQRAGADPGERVARKAVRRQLARHRADEQTDERHEAELAQGRAPQRAPAVDRREEHVADVGALEGQRSAPAPGAHAEGDGQRSDAAQPARAVLQHLARHRPDPRHRRRSPPRG